MTYVNLANPQDADFNSATDFQEDFVLAATWQPTYTWDENVARTDAQYCDEQVTKLTVNTKDLMTLGTQFNGLTKCSYLIYTESATSDKAPAFKVSDSMDDGTLYTDYSLNYIEFTTAPLTIGSTPTYPADDLFPVVTSAVTGLEVLNFTPTELSPGTIACGQNGLYKKIDSWYNMTPRNIGGCEEIVAERAHYAHYVEQYEIAKTRFESDKANYQNNLIGEATRIGNLFTNLFELPIAVPDRPEAPSQPPAYSGKYLVIDEAA